MDNIFVDLHECVYTHNSAVTNRLNIGSISSYSYSLVYLSFIFYKIINIYIQNTKRNAPFIPPDFGMCFDTSRMFQKSTKAWCYRAVDMKCTQTQYQYIRQIADELQAKSYYIMYGLFTLVLLFFTMKLTVNRKTYHLILTTIS